MVVALLKFRVLSSCSPSSAFQVVLLKVRVVVVVLIHRLKDLKMREAALLMCLKSQVKFLLSTQIQNSPPLVPGAGSLRRRQNLNHPGARWFAPQAKLRAPNTSSFGD